MAETFDLGIDTASDDASLALVSEDGRVVAERAWRVTSTVSRELLGQVDALLREAGVDRAQVHRVAVDVGPGQYGALRAGIATAQGLALALDVPLAGIPRLEADAARLAAPAGSVVVAVHDVGRAVAWGAYEMDGEGLPREVVPSSMTTHAEAAAAAPRPAKWVGELTEALAAARDAEGRTGDTIAAEPATSRAVALVRLARAREAFGDPGQVDALYLRPPSITRPSR